MAETLIEYDEDLEVENSELEGTGPQITLESGEKVPLEVVKTFAELGDPVAQKYLDEYETGENKEPGVVEIPGIGTLEDYNAQVHATGEPVDLKIVELFAVAGDQVAQAYLDHVAAMEELIEKINVFEDALEAAESLEDLMTLVSGIVHEIEAAPIPAQQQEALKNDPRLRESCNKAERRILDLHPEESQIEN